MNRKEFIEGFLKKLNSKDLEGISHYFTPRSIAYNLDELHSVAIEDYIKYEMQRVGERIITDIIESKVCIKIKYSIDVEPYAYLIELDGKRISNIEFGHKK
ncbi:MAG: hypothetical protein HUJ61_02045 [Bacilli bacterium]|nr:hypothetical protein [Bacilli bacterium]